MSRGRARADTHAHTHPQTHALLQGAIALRWQLRQGLDRNRRAEGELPVRTGVVREGGKDPHALTRGAWTWTEGRPQVCREGRSEGEVTVRWWGSGGAQDEVGRGASPRVWAVARTQTMQRGQRSRPQRGARASHPSRQP